MRRLFAVVALLSAALPASAAAGPAAKPGPGADVAAVRHVTDIHVERFNAADWKAIRSEFTNDALMMHQFAADATGPDSIASLFRDDFSQIASSKLKLTMTARVEETEIHGPWAFNRGVYTFTATNEKGDSKSRDVRFLEILARQADGSWKIARSIDNTPQWPYPQSTR